MGALAKPMKLPRQRCFWPRMTPVLSQASNYSSTAADAKSECPRCKERDGNDPHRHPGRLSKRVAGDGRLVAARRAREITVFNDHLSDFDDIVERLLPFDVVCVMRERTPLPRSVIERLPQLKLIASTGPRNAAIDVEAAAERGIVVAHTGYDARSTIEMTWALILASVRQVALENAHLRAGGWQLHGG